MGCAFKMMKTCISYKRLAAQILFIVLFGGNFSILTVKTLAHSSYCKIGHCKNWQMIVLVVLSPSFPPKEFDKIIEFVFDATNSCTQIGGKTMTAFTYLNDNRRELVWMNSRKQFNDYFRSPFFNYTAQVQEVFPSEQLIASGILRLVDRMNALHAKPMLGKYILVISAYELYLATKGSEDLRIRLDMGGIRLKILEFSDYAEDSIDYDSDENYFEMIAEHEQISEVDTVNELFKSKLRSRLFPCEDHSAADDAIEVGDSTNNAYEITTYSDDNNYHYQTLVAQDNVDAHAEDDDDDSGAGFWKTAWPYAIAVVFILILVLVIMAIYFAKRSKLQQTNRKIGLLKRIAAAVNEYYEQEGNQWEVNERDLHIDYMQKLGSGAFSVVYKGKLRGIAPVCKRNPSVVLQHKYRDCTVAVKMLPPFADIAARSDFIQEINLMKSLVYHPHLLCILGVADNADGNLCLVVEYCEKGDLLHYIRDNKQLIVEGNTDGLKFKNLLCFAWQISDGLYYLNSKDIIHRDIAARNVLVDGESTAKIGDFGLCRLTDDAVYRTRGGRLPVKWMAIESLKQYEFTPKTDVWSFGVLLFELFSVGDVPFPEVQPADMILHLEAGNRLSPPPHCSQEIAILMQSCWLEDPMARPSIEKIRGQLATVLDGSSEDYGYFRVHDSDYVNTDVT